LATVFKRQRGGKAEEGRVEKEEGRKEQGKERDESTDTE
jgi:hypothetical protein